MKKIKISAVCPALKLADVKFNTKAIVEEMKKAAEKGVELLVFPELTVCGATCGELFSQSFFIEKCEKAMEEIVLASKGLNLVVVVGAPAEIFTSCGVSCYNCAFVLKDGEILRIIPKITLTAAETGYFAEYVRAGYGEFNDKKVKFGGNSLPVRINGKRVKLFIAIGSDEYLPDMNYGQLTVCMAALPTVGVPNIEKRLSSVYFKGTWLFVNAGLYESTAQDIYGGEKVLLQNGKLLAEVPAFSSDDLIYEVDLLNKEHAPYCEEENCLENACDKKMPFLPTDEKERAALPEFVLNAAGYALKARMERSYAKTAVIGVSGGLDSTLALLIVERAFELMNRDKKDIIAITMPGFGTTGKTYQNSLTLMNSVGATVKEIDITKSVLQHFEDIGHDKKDYSVTYENAQARTRTLILMDIANKTGGLVIGTGDLSEIALGWSTYNGDHMSMYAVNAALPKTLIRYLVGVIAEKSTGERGRVLKEIYEQIISPELLPPDADGEIAQKTEDLVGPYELHDYFLYLFVHEGYSPKEIYESACETFVDEYEAETILKWLKVFFKRFTTQQFKRSCSPDCAGIGVISLCGQSWRMPADLSPTTFLEELENL